jgi:hypothetical protein
MGIYHDVVRVTTTGPTLPLLDSLEAKSEPPRGYSVPEMISTTIIASGENLLFSVPLDHVGPSWYVQIRFYLDKDVTLWYCVSANFNRSVTVPRRATLHHLTPPMYSSNLFPFIRFRTALHDRNALNSFPSKRLRTTFIATAGWGVSYLDPSLPTHHCPLCTVFCFQQLPTVKFSNPFFLITIRIARGVPLLSE